VSRILNNDQSLSVKAETRQRVYEVAEKLNYRPLRKGCKKISSFSSGTFEVGIILCQTLKEEMNDIYFLSIRQGIEKECQNHNFIKPQIIRWKDISSKQQLNKYDGLIVVGGLTTKALKYVNGEEKHIVHINHEPNMNYDSVVTDFYNATYHALSHLESNGYTQIGYIGGSENKHDINGKVEIRDKRFIAYKDFMEKYNIFNEEHCYIGEFSMTDGYRLMQKSITNGNFPKAFFIASDPMAIGAMRALREANLKVPEDVALVSFNDVDLAKFASTPLTSVKVYTEEMGREAVKLLIDRFNGRVIPLQIVVPATLSVRASCGRKKVKA